MKPAALAWRSHDDLTCQAIGDHNTGQIGRDQGCSARQVAVADDDRYVTYTSNDWAEPRVRDTVRVTPSLTKVTATRVPGCRERIASSSVASSIGRPASRTITSPGRRPARAGPPGAAA